MQVHRTGPASTTPASTTGSASHFAAAQRSWLLQRTHASPPIPHSSRAVPSTHSVSDAQHPSQVVLSHGRGQALDNIRKTNRLHRTGGSL